ncbi:hypothetical protein KIW84_015798 [Lathyrus oleraceus]|uniref:Uncharacterized protein n=1 Tax=Pisum sativum TaxID=3888 RepID=A0A9D5H109_PEA|nr:hypothetical protein KIW84_015798 [Pisum sativum]
MCPWDEDLYDKRLLEVDASPLMRPIDDFLPNFGLLILKPGPFTMEQTRAGFHGRFSASHCCLQPFFLKQYEKKISFSIQDNFRYASENQPAKKNVVKLITNHGGKQAWWQHICIYFYHQMVQDFGQELKGEPINPLAMRRTPSRPKKKRNKANDKLTSRNMLPRNLTTVKCKIYGNFWHNSRACKGKTLADQQFSKGSNKTRKQKRASTKEAPTILTQGSQAPQTQDTTRLDM